MIHTNLVRVLALTFMVVASLMCSSCTGSSGMGVSMGYPSRWSASGGPPVFAGGPP